MTDLQAQLQSTLGGAYTLERELGGGGMSRVFVADEVRLGRKVVVKVLSPELAIAEKRPRDAVVEFRRGDRLADGYPGISDDAWAHAAVGRAFDLASEPDSAITELEAYVRSSYGNRFVDDVLFFAGAHKRLGELYDAKGDRRNAIAHLSKFVELWKNADPELQPAVQDAKKRLARLSVGEKR